jgi:hypothetical protein
MEFFVPVQPATFSVNPVTPSQKSADAVQHNLQPYQVVQATVAEKGEGRVLLDMGGKQMWAQSRADVKTGQQLNLQVTSTEPRLQLRVVPQGAEKHMLRILHLFDHKPELGTRLQQLSSQTSDRNANQQLQQLAQQFLGQRPAPTGEQLLRIAAPLQEALSRIQSANQNIRSELAVQMQQLPAHAAQVASPTLPQNTQQAFAQLLNNLTAALQALNSSGTGTTAANSAALSAQIEQILSPLMQTAPGTKTNPEGLQQIQTLLTRLAKTGMSGTTIPGQGSTPAGTETPHLQALSSSLLHSLAQSLGNMQMHMATPPPRELALLAQVLGLNFEGRLLNGEIEQARNSLKGVLLQLKAQEDSPAQVRENSSNLLQQLELFQLCRGRLAHDGILFLPLPYDFLQQGYALIQEHADEGDEKGADKERTLSVTLNLTLENLGSLNIYMLFEREQLFMRISCTEPQTTALVQNSSEELDAILRPLGLKRLNIDANGKDPAVALLDRLSPDRSVLDARV